MELYRTFRSCKMQESLLSGIFVLQEAVAAP
jgi:hypothetical protein